MRFSYFIAAVAAVAGLSSAARAADEDVRCLLASNLFTKAEQDPAKRQVALLSAYFYLGRVDARLNGTQLAAALKAEAKAINSAAAGATMTACAKRVQSAGAAIQVMGKDLQTGK
jgi:hypothetical protein